MNMKSILCAAAATSSMMLLASDTPEVSNVTMTQASFGRQVTIAYQLSNAPDGAVVTLDVQTNRTGAVTANDADWISIGGEAVCNAQGDVWKKVAQGSHTITWRPDLSWEGHKIEFANGGARAVVTAWALDNTPDYMVVDITQAAQPNTQRYYPSVDFLPGGLLGKDEYRTTSIVMRKIMAKDVTWTMGSTTLETLRTESREATHQVTLTNNYYIGVFPVTQAQWGLIQTSNNAPSSYDNAADRAMHPVERVCYNEIRNSVNSTTANPTYNWPHNPNPGSFLGNLRTKSGIDFDLPSEAQWEFAARAGNGDTKWGDGTGILNGAQDDNLDRLGRYKDGDNTPSTAIVGSYAPNSWGLYDTAGNVWEWCLDWHADDITEIGGKVNIAPTDPTSTLTGTEAKARVFRGGSKGETAAACRPARRDPGQHTRRYDVVGFRLCCTAGLR